MYMKNTKTLTGQLKKTVLLLGIAMIMMWIFFYAGIREMIRGYVLHNMEQAAKQGIFQINTSFLQMEQLDVAMRQEQALIALFGQEDNIGFHNAAAAAEERLLELIRGKNFLSSIIIYQNGGYFYRLRGTISNTGVERLLYLIEAQEEDYVCAKLDNENYIGYITKLDGIGGIAMLMKETEIEKMLGQQSEQDGVHFVLTAGDRIIAAGDNSVTAKSISEFCDKAEHIKSAQIGYTPFSLWVSYNAGSGKIHIMFLTAMTLMAVLLLFILQAFLHFWRKNFFAPIQTVIDEVEAFEGGREKQLKFTGLEHFDGLISGINDLAARIEAKDKALIVSLKKQINAHFIFNILNIIKALSEKGESKKAGELCSGLSLLLRYANDGESFISGMEEFYILENYVEIMEIRYPNRFCADIEMDDFLEDLKLPRMLLQPIVENSIVHGLIGGGKKGTVHVYAVVEEKAAKYIVEDDGCGMSVEALEKLRGEIDAAQLTEDEPEGLSHVALVNIEKRIKSYFGADYGLTISSLEGKGTKVVVTLPGR